MNEQEYSNVYAIPANYTDSGKLLGGMLEPRNAVETVILVCLAGYPELVLIPMQATVRIVVMVLTLLPLAVVSMMGIDGDSLGQYTGHMVRFLFRRRRLHMKRVGYTYEQEKRRGRRKAKEHKEAKESKKV